MSTKTILVVDDEPFIVHVVSLKLKNAGYTVLTAKDGDDALETAASAAIDLLITDYQMPGMTGLELARRIHAEPGRRQLPAMLLTAHGMALEQVEMRQAGITFRLSKPFSPRELLDKVQELLTARELAAAGATSADSCI